MGDKVLTESQLRKIELIKELMQKGLDEMDKEFDKYLKQLYEVKDGN